MSRAEVLCHNRLFSENLNHDLTILANIVNSIQQYKFPTASKAAEVIPIHKTNDQLLRENHRPVSILTSLSKVI